MSRPDILDRLKRHGVQPTPQRVEVAAVLLDRPQHLSADQILERLRAAGSRVSKATVYNTLRAFCDGCDVLTLENEFVLAGPLAELEGLVDEYYEAAGVDPRRTAWLRDQILALSQRLGLDRDIGIRADDSADAALARLDNHLCELKELQIRDGLHVFGEAPAGEQLTDLLAALVRGPRKAGEAGLLGASIPAEYGGSGGSYAHESAIIEAISHVGVDGFGIALHNYHDRQGSFPLGGVLVARPRPERALADGHDRLAQLVDLAVTPDRVEALEDEPDRIDQRMAPRAVRVPPVLLQPLPLALRYPGAIQIQRDVVRRRRHVLA